MPYLEEKAFTCRGPSPGVWPLWLSLPSPPLLLLLPAWVTLIICSRISSILERLSCSICWAVDNILILDNNITSRDNKTSSPRCFPDGSARTRVCSQQNTVSGCSRSWSEQVSEHEEITAANTTHFHTDREQVCKRDAFSSAVSTMTLHFTNLRVMLSLRAE